MEPRTCIVDAERAGELIVQLVGRGATFRASSAGDGKVRFTVQERMERPDGGTPDDLLGGAR